MHGGQYRNASATDRARRYPALDGLRGIAVTAVLANHLVPASPPESQWWLWPLCGLQRIGWSGVDLFFVLSGFLITGVLLEHRKAPRYFVPFYAHRALRILPIYYLLLILLTLAAPAARILPPPNGPMWPYWLFASNLSLFFWMAWSPQLALSWTLSIEEQFYLLWAPAVRYLTNTGLVRLALTLLIGALAVRCIVLITPPAEPPGKAAVLAGFTLTRLDGLAVGILIRMAADIPSRQTWLIAFARSWWLWAASVAATLALDAATGWANVGNNAQLDMVRFGFTLLALMFGAIMAHSLLIDGWLRRLCSLAPLRQIGTWSYFLYLYCEPVDAAVRAGVRVTIGELPLPTQLVLTCLALFATAEISRRLLEQPALGLKRFFPYSITPQDIGGRRAPAP